MGFLQLYDEPWRDTTFRRQSGSVEMDTGDFKIPKLHHKRGNYFVVFDLMA
jgi:hypothetical protein